MKQPKARILVVEDDAALLQGLLDVLVFNGYDVKGAMDGGQGLKTGLAERFDLILRSRQPLAEAMRRDITEIFEEANAIVGGTGQILFQASADWSPMPLAPGSGGESDLLA